jgi:NAD(P) transhydrogenase subunit alpha
MRPGAVIVDLAAEGGGNCELSKPGKTTRHQGVTLHAPLNVPSQVAYQATEIYAKNLYNFFQPMLHEGAIKLDWEDEVFAGAVVTHDGEIKHEPTRKLVEGEHTSSRASSRCTSSCWPHSPATRSSPRVR